MKVLTKLTVHIDQATVGGKYRWYVCDQFRNVYARSVNEYRSRGSARKSYKAWARRLSAAPIVTHTAVQLPLFGRLEAS